MKRDGFEWLLLGYRRSDFCLKAYCNISLLLNTPQRVGHADVWCRVCRNGWRHLTVRLYMACIDTLACHTQHRENGACSVHGKRLFFAHWDFCLFGATFIRSFAWARELLRIYTPQRPSRMAPGLRHLGISPGQRAVSRHLHRRATGHGISWQKAWRTLGQGTENAVLWLHSDMSGWPTDGQRQGLMWSSGISFTTISDVPEGPAGVYWADLWTERERTVRPEHICRKANTGGKATYNITGGKRTFSPTQNTGRENRASSHGRKHKRRGGERRGGCSAKARYVFITFFSVCCFKDDCVPQTWLSLSASEFACF